MAFDLQYDGDDVVFYAGTHIAQMQLIAQVQFMSPIECGSEKFTH